MHLLRYQAWLQDGVSGYIFTLHHIALIYYEYIITFYQEVATVWRRRLTLTSLLLLSTRYVLLLSTVWILIPATPVVSISNLLCCQFLTEYTDVRHYLPTDSIGISTDQIDSCGKGIGIAQNIVVFMGYTQTACGCPPFT